MKNKLLVIALAAMLTACGGGGSTPAPVSTALHDAQAFFAGYDAARATTIPATGASAFAFTDGCSLENGRTKAFAVAEFDANPLAVARDQFIVGSTRTNVQVLAERSFNNADGTARREIDVQYVINYQDGTKNEAATQTLISGSSSGSRSPDGTACTAAENKAALRFFGNRKVVNTFVNATNERVERTSLATGLPLSPTVGYSKYISLGVQDPAHVATYATISGPGLIFSDRTPLTLKLVSPRLLRDAPEFAGKRGHYVDWDDTDSFQVCRTAADEYASAETADCVAHGASGVGWGSFNFDDPAALDASFGSFGVVAGGQYTIKIYGGVGWKTINGQSTETPIATYVSTLSHLPFGAVALAGTGVISDLFARVLTNTRTAAQIATEINNKAAFSVGLTWRIPGAMPDARAVALSSLYSFESGRQAAVQPNFNPASRRFDPTYPGSQATAATLNVPAPGPNMAVPTYGEAGFIYVNRNGNIVRTTYTYQ